MGFNPHPPSLPRGPFQFGATLGGMYLGSMVGGPLGAVVGAAVVGTAFNLLWPLEADLETPDSSTYAWGGYQNQMRPGGPVPIVFGKHKIAPPVAGSVVTYRLEADGAYFKIPDHADLELVLASSEGPVQSLSAIKLDRNAIDGDPDILSTVSLGECSPAEDYTFPRARTQVVKSLDISDGETKSFTTDGDVDRLWFNFSVEKLYRAANQGLLSSTVHIQWRYRINPAGDWSEWQEKMIRDTRTGKAYFGFAAFEGEDLDTYDIELKLEYQTNDDVVLVLESTVEQNSEIFKFPYTAWARVYRIPVEKLRGGIPTVTCEIEGRKLRSWDGESMQAEAYSNNPAWIVLDMLTNKRYGGGNQISDDDIDLDNFKAFADYCDTQVDGENLHEINCVADFRSRARDLVDKVLSTCRASLDDSSGKYRIIWDRAQDPAAVFSMGNIIKGSYSGHWFSRRDRYNTLEIYYMNEDDDWERNVINLQVGDLYGSAPVEPERKLSVELFGCTRYTQAAREANYNLRKMALINRAIEFTADIEGLGLQRGDVIAFQHDVPTGWGWGGRISSKLSPDRAVLDQEVTLAEGKSYKIVIWLDDNTVAEADVQNSAGATDEIKFDTEDIAFAAFSTGQPYIIYETSAGELKEFRVAEITPAEGHFRRIRALAYDEDVYSEATIEAPTSTAAEPPPSPIAAPPAVTDLTLTENPERMGSILVTWAADSDYLYYDHFQVLVSKTGTYFIQYADVGGCSCAIHPVDPGSKWWVRVIAWNKQGRSSSAVTGSIEFTGQIYWSPADVTGLELFGQGHGTEFMGRDAKFRWTQTCVGKGADFEPADEEICGSGQGYQAEYFDGYIVVIESLDADSNWVERRREHVYENRYVYTWEKNYEDHGGSPKNQFRISVWEISKQAVMSVNPAVLTVSNPAPSRPSGVTVFESLKGIMLVWDRNPEADVADAGAYRVWASQTPSFEPSNDSLIYDGPANLIEKKCGTNETWYFRVAAVDSFGTESERTDEYSGTSSFIQSFDLAFDAVGDEAAINMLRFSDFEADDALDYWDAHQCTRARENGEGVSGYALEITKSLGAGNEAYIYTPSAKRFAALAGEKFVGSLYVKSSDGVDCYLFLEAYNSGGSFISAFASDSVTASSSYARLSATGTAPAGTATIRIRVAFDSDEDASSVMYLDRVMLHRGEKLRGWVAHPREFIELGLYLLQHAELGDDAVDTNNVAALAITTTEIDDDAISTPKLQANSVTAAIVYSGVTMSLRIAASNLRTDTAVITQAAQIANLIVSPGKLTVSQMENLISGSGFYFVESPGENPIIPCWAVTGVSGLEIHQFSFGGPVSGGGIRYTTTRTDATGILMSDEFRVKNKDTLSISVYARTNNISGSSKSSMYIKWYDASHSYIGSSSAAEISGDSGWVWLKVENIPVHGGAYYARLTLVCGKWDGLQDGGHTEFDAPAVVSGEQAASEAWQALGLTEVEGRLLTTGRVQSTDKKTYFDLDDQRLVMVDTS